MRGEECRMDSGLSCPCPSKAEWSGQQKAPQIWGYWGRALFFFFFYRFIEPWKFVQSGARRPIGGS